MMIRINLAPRVDQSTGKTALIRDIIIVVLCAVGVHYYIEDYAKQYDQQIEDVQKKITEYKSSKENLKKEIEKSKEIKSKAEQIKVRSNRVRQLGEGRKLSVVLLDSLQSKHPERMWFTKISYTTKTQTLQLNGFALDHTVIADYMKRLKEIGKIDGGEYAELKEFIPPQLLNSDSAAKEPPVSVLYNTQTFDKVTLKELISSEELQGVTLQKFEISIRVTNG
jgi:Tfp pilus assembly protein PilN